MQCSLEEVYWRFGGTQYLHLRFRNGPSERHAWVHCTCFVYPGGRFPVLTTEAGTAQRGLHGDTCQETVYEFLTFIAVRTSDLVRRRRILVARVLRFSSRWAYGFLSYGMWPSLSDRSLSLFLENCPEGSSETFVTISYTTRRHIPEEFEFNKFLSYSFRGLYDLR